MEELSHGCPMATERRAEVDHRQRSDSSSTRKRSVACGRPTTRSLRGPPCGWPRRPRTCSVPARPRRAGSTSPVSTASSARRRRDRRRTADVQGMCTYEDLVDATLPHGLIPLVVPQLRTITLGGAVTGLGIESTSFRNGLPHESVLEMDVFTGAGEVVTASPTTSTPTCSRPSRTPTAPSATPPGCASSWSRSARTSRCDTCGSTTPRPRRRRSPRSPRPAQWAGERVDGLDGTAFEPGCSTLTLARWTSSPEGATLGLHRPAGLLALGAEARDRPAHHLRLPLALGHRLVLVLAGLRRPAPRRAPALAAAAASLRHLPPARRPRPALRRGRPARPPGRPPAARAGGAGHRGARRAARGVPRRGSTRRSACGRCGCARCGCVPAWSRVPPRPTTGRGRRTPWPRTAPTSTSASGAPCPSGPRPPRARSTGRSRHEGRRPRGSQVALLRVLLRRRDLRPALRRTRTWRGQGALRPRSPTHHPLRQGGATMTPMTPDRQRSPAPGSTLAEVFESLLLRPAPVRFTAYDGSCLRPRGRPRRAEPEERARPGLPGHRARRPRPGPRLRLRRPRRASACTRETPTRRWSCCCARCASVGRAPAQVVQLLRSIGLTQMVPPPPPPQEHLPRWRRLVEGFRHSPERDGKVIEHHYDVSNRFYELVLGPSMTYTCAVYETEEETLEEAQFAKYDLVARKLDLQRGTAAARRRLRLGRHGPPRGAGVRRQGARRDALARAGRVGPGRDQGGGARPPRRGAPPRLPRRARDRLRRGQLDRSDRAHRRGQLRVVLRVPARAGSAPAAGCSTTASPGPTTSPRRRVRSSTATSSPTGS